MGVFVLEICPRIWQAIYCAKLQLYGNFDGWQLKRQRIGRKRGSYMNLGLSTEGLDFLTWNFGVGAR